MVKRYGSLLEMLSDSDDQEILDLKEKLESNSRSMELARTLFNIRNMQGISQEDLSEKIGISLDLVEEIEHCPDEKMKMSVFGGYILALGYTMDLTIYKDEKSKDEKISDTVTHHLHKIRESIEKLANLCKDDPEMEQNAAKYLGTIFLSFGKSVDDAAEEMDEMIEIPTDLFRAITFTGQNNENNSIGMEVKDKELV